MPVEVRLALGQMRSARPAHQALHVPRHGAVLIGQGIGCDDVAAGADRDEPILVQLISAEAASHHHVVEIAPFRVSRDVPLLHVSSDEHGNREGTAT